ncbi:MAG: hypothetical protein ACU0CQ_06770 [Sulfitobacter sp.]|uniref:hypothetical protein n=1 Tax=Sulfitobacter sp. TaxID=1903071 RepID=UPI0040597227
MILFGKQRASFLTGDIPLLILKIVNLREPIQGTPIQCAARYVFDTPADFHQQKHNGKISLHRFAPLFITSTGAQQTGHGQFW